MKVNLNLSLVTVGSTPSADICEEIPLGRPYIIEVDVPDEMLDIIRQKYRGPQYDKVIGCREKTHVGLMFDDATLGQIVAGEPQS